MVLIGIAEEELKVSDNGRFYTEDPRRFVLSIISNGLTTTERMTARDMQNLAYAMLELSGGGDSEEVLLEVKVIN